MTKDDMIGRYKRMLREEESWTDHYKKRYYEVSNERDHYKQLYCRVKARTYVWKCATFYLIFLLVIVVLIFLDKLSVW